MTDDLTPEEIAIFRKERKLRKEIQQLQVEVNEIAQAFMKHGENTDPGEANVLKRELALKQGEIFKKQEELANL